MRRRRAENPGRNELKHGHGGLADIEFLVQYLQVVHASTAPEVLRPNLWEALDALRRTGRIDRRTHADLRDAYDFWRTVESRLRIVHNRGGADLPEDPRELARLARRLDYEGTDPETLASAFRADADRHAARCRQLFDEIVSVPAGQAD